MRLLNRTLADTDGPTDSVRDRPFARRATMSLAFSLLLSLSRLTLAIMAPAISPTDVGVAPAEEKPS